MKKIDHLAIAVHNLDRANKLFEKVFGKKHYKIDIIDSRNHIAGNCFDYKDKYGVLVHKYGPHYFRTNNKLIL